MSDAPRAEKWIISAAAIIITGLVGLFVRVSLTAFGEQTKKIDQLGTRFAVVESQIQSVHLQLVDVPNMKLEMARLDIRVQQLQAEVRDIQQRNR